MIVNACGSSIGNPPSARGRRRCRRHLPPTALLGFLRRDISTMVIVTGVWNVLAQVVLPVVGILAIVIGIGQLNLVVAQAAIIGRSSASPSSSPSGVLRPRTSPTSWAGC